MRMRSVGSGVVGLAALVALVALLASPASAAKDKKLVEGTVYDTTCVTACLPECPPPPHCGPVAQVRAGTICAQRRRLIVCPLVTTGPQPVCVRAAGCPPYPTYGGEGAVINVRRRGSATVIARLAVVAGYFKLRLGPGEYVLHPYLPEEPCWSGAPAMVKVAARHRGSIPAAVYVSDGCVVHADASR